MKRVAENAVKSSYEEIDWASVLLDLWESGDEYINVFVQIRVSRTLSEHYRITDQKLNCRGFSNHKKAIQCLRNIQAEHNSFLRGLES